MALPTFDFVSNKRSPNKRLPGLLLSATLLLLMLPAGVLAQSTRQPVNLGTAGDYVLLSKTGITNVPSSAIIGNIGASPITGAALHVTCAEVTGTISAVDAAGPAPCTLQVPGALGQAVLDMETAYTDAAGRTIPDFTELGAGDISGMTLLPGLYKWSTGVFVDGTGITLTGGPNAVWIFQISGDILLASNAHINLAGGAQANNVFWQTGGPTSATLGLGSVFNGTILSAKQVIVNTGATLNGRALASTQVTLQMNSVTSPGPLVSGVPVVVPPTVSSTVPVNLSMDVPLGNALSATFSEAMDPLTISAATFTLETGATIVPGVVNYTGVTATFTPSSGLLPFTSYTATITTGAEDPQGVALAADYIWTFMTGATPDATAPTVSSTAPLNGAANVPLGNALSATFSEAMNPLTISATTFLLDQGGAAVAGAVSYSGVTATFTPASQLAPNVPFTATITNGAEDLAGNPLAADYIWTFTSGATPDATAPTVSSTVPLNGAANVSLGNALSATFSEAMDPLTISAATFILDQGGAAVTGTVSYSGVTATFTPASQLTLNAPFTATITTGAKDLGGNALGADYSWTFTSGATPDATAPTVSSTVPLNGAAAVLVGNALSATFSEAMNPLTISAATFILDQGGAAVAGAVSYSGVTATFTPASQLTPNASFTATITTGAKDLGGNALGADHIWTFTTAATPLITPPTVSSTAPHDGATLVTLTTDVVANFSELMDPSTISTSTFSLTAGTTPVPGTVSYSGVTATFRPVGLLAPNTTYTATITAGVRDWVGNAMAANYSWSFMTGASFGQLPVCLTDFSILSGSAVISSGLTTVTGSVGVSPGASVSGFPPGTLSGGMIHAGDADAAQAMASVFAGYADAVSRSIGPVAISGDLGGQAFTPGLYRSISSLTISLGDVTLDAKGDANAVFIFQIASTLTTSAGRKIILAGGAQAANVFWQVGSSATLGSGSEFPGSILADESITLNAGAMLSGRLLALNGTITLASNVITGPVPEVSAGGVLNSAGWSPTVAAGSIAAVFGNNLAAELNVASTFPLPTTLGVSSFQVGTQGAPLYMSSCGQANVQIPWEVAGQTAVPVTVTVNELESVSQLAAVAPFAPGIYTLNMSGSGQGAVQIAPSDQLAAPLAPGARPVVAGEYIAIFVTGLGPVTNQPETGAAALSVPLSHTTTMPTVTIGGVAALVTYSGLAPGFAGLYQVNAVVPQGTPSGDSISAVISMGGVESNTVTIAVQ